MGLIGDVISSISGNPLGWASLGASLLGGFSQSSSQKEINAANIAMQRETNALQEKLFNQNLDWQRESQQIQNDYNSAISQKNRALAAGLSPMMVAGAQPTSAGSGSPGSGIPSMSAPHAQMIDSPLSNTIGNVSLLAKSISDLSQAGLSSAQEKRTLALLDSELTGMKIDNTQKDAALKLYFKFADKRMQAEYDNLIKDLAVKESEIELNGELSLTEKEKRFNIVADSMLKDSQRLLNKKEYDVFEDRFKTWRDEMLARIRLTKAQAQTEDVLRGPRAQNLNAQTGLFGSQAEYYSQLGRFESAKADWEEWHNDYLNQNVTIKDPSTGVKVVRKRFEHLFTSELQNAISEAAKTDRQAQLLWQDIQRVKQEIKIAEKQNKWYVFNNLVQQFSTLVGSSSNLLQYFMPKLSHGSVEVNSTNVPYDSGNRRPIGFNAE